MNKISSTKIAVGFVALIACVYFGYQFIAGRLIDSKHFMSIEPGRVTLLGIDAGSHYKIIVSNEIAQLVYVANGKLEAGGDAFGDEGDTDKQRIPLKETVQSLQGNTKALGKLVTAMNDDLRKEQQDIAPNPVVWKASDIEKALKGDAKLQAKLERDLNCKLDGTPADFINVTAVYTGIAVDLPVQVTVAVHDVPKTLTATVRFPFRPRFTTEVETALNNDQSASLNPSADTIRGHYLEVAAKILSGKEKKQNIAADLEAKISPQVSRSYAAAAEHVLANTKVVLNENFVKDASMEQEGQDSSGHPLYDLNLDLTNEGRERLWQYSRHRSGTQLLLIVDGVAIAAPYVGHELAQSRVTITQMPDQSLVENAIDDIKAARPANVAQR